MKLVKYPDELLNKQCATITVFGTSVLKQLAEDMLIMLRPISGVALAAPQVGRSIRMFVYSWAGEEYIVLNPEIVEAKGKQSGQEGCLSLPGFWHQVKRSRSVVLKGQNLVGRELTIKANGLKARAFQHEVDHLEGKLYIHKISEAKQKEVGKRVEDLQQRGEW